jgi:hypothetical protein
VDKPGQSGESRGQVALTHRVGSPSVLISPEGPSDTNGCDHINAHVSGRFLRAL